MSVPWYSIIIAVVVAGLGYMGYRYFSTPVVPAYPPMGMTGGSMQKMVTNKYVLGAAAVALVYYLWKKQQDSQEY